MAPIAETGVGDRVMPPQFTSPDIDIGPENTESPENDASPLDSMPELPVTVVIAAGSAAAAAATAGVETADATEADVVVDESRIAALIALLARIALDGLNPPSIRACSRSLIRRPQFLARG
jgi:hypothetical protein